MLWQKLPGLAHLREKVFDIGADDTLILLVRLGEDETKGDAPLAQLVDKFQIDLLRRMPAIDKDEDADEVLPFAQIIFDHLFPLFTLVLGDFGEAITGEVDDIPGIVDVEMVDQLRLTGRTGGLGQFIAVAKHIDQRRLTDIAASDEGILRAIRCGTFRIIRTANYVNTRMDVHG